MTSAHRIALVGAVAIAASITPTSTQPLTAEDVLALAKKHLIPKTSAEQPAQDSVPAGESGGVTIEAGEDKQVARIRLSYYLSRRSSLSMGISSPFGPEQTQVDFVDLDGLSNTLNTEVGYTWTAWRPPGTFIEVDETVSDEQRREAEGKMKAKAFHRDKLLLCLASLRERPEMRHLLPDPEELIAYLDIKAPDYDKLSKERKAPLLRARALEESCTDEVITSPAVAGTLPRAAVEWRELLDEPPVTPMFSVLGKVGRKKYDFRDPNTLASEDSVEVPYSYGLAVGILHKGPSGRDSVAWLKVSREEIFEEGKEAQTCTPTSGGAAETCEKFRLGEPTSQETTVYDIEYRAFLSRRFGLSLRVFRKDFDAMEDVTGVDLPVYFLTDAAGGLTGGIRASWRSNDDDLSAAIFVGKVLKLLDR